MSVDLNLLSRNMKLLRIMNGFSQEELASRIYISRTTYTAYENCHKTPSLQTLDSLAALYNIGFDTLVFQDLSLRPLNNMYLNNQEPDLGRLLTEYEQLTISSRKLIMERMNTLLEREEIFYTHYSRNTAAVRFT